MEVKPQLPPPAIIFGILQGEWVSICLKTAVNLNVPDHLKDGPKTAQQLGEAAQANPDYLGRVMRVLASAGVFDEDVEKGTFSNTPVSEYLVSGVRGNGNAVVKMLGQESHQKPWDPQILLECVKTGKMGFELAFGEGQDFWKYCTARPDVQDLFWQTMEGTATLFHSNIVSTYDFSPFKSLCDVGGGWGTLLQKIMHKYPSLRGVLFDIPFVVEKAKIKEDKELEGRLECVAGDFFKSVPEGVDAYITTTVLHDWNDEKAGLILDSIHKAASPSSKLLIGDTIVPAETAPLHSKLMSVHMMTICDGKERTEKEWKELLSKHGWNLVKVHPTVPHLDFYLLEAERV